MAGGRSRLRCQQCYKVRKEAASEDDAFNETDNPNLGHCTAQLIHHFDHCEPFLIAVLPNQRVLPFMHSLTHRQHFASCDDLFAVCAPEICSLVCLHFSSNSRT